MAVVVFFGAPGSGKGTQAKILCSNQNYSHISTGDLLRECKNDVNHPLYALISAKMLAGELIDDEIVNDIVSHKISQIELDNIIFDGYPRTVNQAIFLNLELLKYNKKIEKVVLFDINPDIVVQRIVNRQVCKKCGTIFNKKFNQSQKDGICDACGGNLESRADDTEETIRNRIEIYQSSSAELLNFYKIILTVVDASNEEKQISKEISDIL
jgi:adenylate kinase